MKDITNKDLMPVLEQVTQYTKNTPIDQYEMAASYSTGLMTSVRNGEVETLETTQEKSLSISVYKDQHVGTSSTSDFSPEALKLCLQRACDIASFTSRDPFAGLADLEHFSDNDQDLSLYHPWHQLDNTKAIELTTECEAYALDQPQITNSEGASLESYYHLVAQTNSNGFCNQTARSRHGLSLSVIAGNEQMQRDYSYTIARDPKDLWNAKTVAESAVSKTLKKLNPQKIKTGHYPVIFTPETARSILGNFLSAITGMTQYRKTSFLTDSVKNKIFPSFISLIEQPQILKGLGSRNYDSDGIPCLEKPIVTEGVLQRYLLSTYSGKALGLPSTGNAGGVSNVTVSHTGDTFDDLIKKMDRGIIVNEMMGQGVNMLTGDYSRGASGFYVENGHIQYPIHEFTVAGNLKDMFHHIIAVANDCDYRSSILTGSILLESMAIACN